MKIHSVKIGFCAQCLESELSECCSPEDKIHCSAEQNEWNCWLQQDGAITYAVKTTRALSWDFFSNHDIGHGFGHESPNLMLPHFILWVFLNGQSAVITQEGCRTPNMTPSRLLMALTNTLFEKLQETPWKGDCLSSRRWRHFQHLL